ncbi:uncharacterized protein NEPG_02626 [Nematocida parisii ERTm1]|uniref:uncharacterized protein n=1 Tax=Nematocida parisii (strain ERTm1 / ATCC PRA-289) TaxID=881290 RepID=UPI000264B4FA|nr:uncharacterized protein NEPG_02626 [Nematocida parisii ERTm1]EIJ92510.1 hypothetical protein NEPG_02626 [Nematocida parisii ERTm1]|eukprot:XP_013060453.1 hypothetical protein NEPG_02626 [Nematocida parisii ERTm1]
MPTTYEEFLKGNFLCNPKFLIQSYFFEYIDSVEMYEEFVRVVYELITEQISNKDEKKSENVCMETGKKAQKVFDSLFIKQDSAELPSKVKYIKHFRLVEHKLNDELQPIPYVESTNSRHDVFLQEFMPSYNRKTDEFVNAELSKYTISIEPALLFLFFLFAFDSRAGRYDISHMPNPSKELKRFFAKYSDPLQVMDYTMYREWHRVVEDLPNKDISYRLNSSDSRNKIQFGILNMIYIMREIAGKNDTKINENIESIKNIINDSDEISDSDIDRFLIDVQKICISFSKNKEIKTQKNGKFFTKELENDIMDIGIYEDLPLEIIYKKKEEDPGSIVIEMDDFSSYADSDHNGRVKCEVSENMLRNKRSNVEKTLYDIKKIYMKSKNYIGCIMRQYANLYLDKISYAIKGEYRFIKRIKYILNSGHTNPNGLLLCGNLETMHYKYEITKIFLEKHRSYTKSYRNIIGKNNPMVQFTRNLIGSVPINEHALKEKFQSSGIYDGEYKNWYPWVE